MSLAQPDTAIKPSLTLKRRLNAPVEKVYAAWTDPEKIVKWFGPDAGPVTRAETDLRVGGRYIIAFNTEDGERHQVGGVYREVVPNEKLVFTWAWHTTPEREVARHRHRQAGRRRFDPDAAARASSSTRRRATVTSAAGADRSTSSKSCFPDTFDEGTPT